MDTQANKLHFALFPFMAPGHMIPMIDIARLLAQRGVIVTIFTTPRNAARCEATLARAIQSQLQIQILQLHFPSVESGLPEGCENLDMMPSLDLAPKIFIAADMMQEQVEKLFVELKPQPNCIISDMCLPYTTDVARKFNIPRIVFHGLGCFYLVCVNNLFCSKVLESVTSESEYFTIPGLPDKVEFTKQQVACMDQRMEKMVKKVFAADLATYGVLVNCFEELEPDYAKEYKKLKNDKVWCIGPVSLQNTDYLDKAERGNKVTVVEHDCLKWLDSQNPNSVVFVCLGSLCNLIPAQMIELGLGLEASNTLFIWVIREGETSKELQKWVVDNGFEERIKGRGFLIWGWAPQVLILSHPSVGGFLTHCGWNSTLEALCAGIPLLTWPLFADQFINQKYIVEVLKIGVSVGVEIPTNWGHEQSVGVLVKRDDVKNAMGRFMDVGKEREERRERARQIANMAKMAVQEGGSSHLNITLLIEDIRQQQYSKSQPKKEI